MAETAEEWVEADAVAMLVAITAAAESRAAVKAGEARKVASVAQREALEATVARAAGEVAVHARCCERGAATCHHLYTSQVVSL